MGEMTEPISFGMSIMDDQELASYIMAETKREAEVRDHRQRAERELQRRLEAKGMDWGYYETSLVREWIKSATPVPVPTQEGG